MGKKNKHPVPPIDYRTILAQAGALPCHPSVVERVQKMPAQDWWIIDHNGVKFLVVSRP